MDEILLLQSDPRALASIARALAPIHGVRTVPGFAEMESLAAKVGPLACVLDVFDSPSKIPLKSLRRLRRNHPAMALVIASDFSGREMTLYHLGRLSVDGVVRMEGHPSSRDLLAVVNRALTASLATRVVQEVVPDIPPMGQEAIRWTIEHAECGPHVSELAASLALSPAVLMRELKAMGLGSPRGLLLWGRLLRASQLLERSSETVESVAFQVGYATGGALGKALKRHLGCSPTELLERGGLTWTLGVFRERVLGASEKERDQWQESE